MVVVVGLAGTYTMAGQKTREAKRFQLSSLEFSTLKRNFETKSDISDETDDEA